MSSDIEIGIDHFVAAVTDPRTGRAVPPVEQVQHVLAEVVAERVIPTLDQGFPELIDPATGRAGGNQTQLWSIGAHVYFQRVRVAKALDALIDREERAPREAVA